LLSTSGGLRAAATQPKEKYKRSDLLPEIFEMVEAKRNQKVVVRVLRLFSFARVIKAHDCTR
jgi:hypothetical protein